VADELKAAATKISETTDLKTQRDNFALLSKNIHELILVFKTTKPFIISIAQCTMKAKERIG